MSDKKRIVTFAKPESAPDPVETNNKIRFRDLRLKPKFREKTIKWKNGDNWARILPPIQGSSFLWMMRIESIQAPDGQGERLPSFCHPKTFERGARSPFDDAFSWFYKEERGALYSREKNPNGLKLTSKSEGLAWMVLIGEEPGEKLGLFCASLYDGSWGGGPGLAYRIWSEANQIDKEPGSPTFEQKVYGDITAPNGGNTILIEKSKPEKGDRYASYTVRIGKASAPVERYVDMLTDEEHDLLVPLEKVIHIPSEEEQHNMLREYIGSKYYRNIFGEGEALGIPSEQNKHSSTQEEEDLEEEPENTNTQEESQHEEEVTPESDPEPTPKSEEKPKKAATKEYGIREISRMMGSKEGVIELLEQIDSLPTSHKKVVLEVAQDLKIDLSKYPGAEE